MSLIFKNNKKLIKFILLFIAFLYSLPNVRLDDEKSGQTNTLCLNKLDQWKESQKAAADNEGRLGIKYNILKTCFEESVRPAITELLTFEDSGEKFKCKEIRGFFLDTPTYSESNICVGTIQKQLSKEEEFLIHEIESDPMLPEDPIYRITDKKLTQIYERYYKEFKLEACVAPLTAFEAYKTNFYDMINSVNNITTTYRIKMLKNQKAFFIKEEVKQENKSESQFDSFTAYAYCFPTSPAPEQGPEMHQQGKPKEVTPESNPTDSGPKIDQTLTK